MEDIVTSKLIWTVLHLIGVAIGMGGAFFGDFLFFHAMKNGVISRPEFRMLRLSSTFVWIGVGILFISGGGLFLFNPEGYLQSSKFISKMFIVGLIAVNGLVFHVVHLKVLRGLTGVTLASSKVFRSGSIGMFISGAISVASWLFVLVLGSLRSLPYTVSEILLVYGCVLVVACLCAIGIRKRFLQK